MPPPSPSLPCPSLSVFSIPAPLLSLSLSPVPPRAASLALPQTFRLDIEVTDQHGHNCSGAVTVEVLPSRRPRVTIL